MIKPIEVQDIIPIWEVFPGELVLKCVYFGIEICQWGLNYVILYIIVSGILLEEILVNQILLPLSKKPGEKLKKNERISFWFNDWLHEFDESEVPGKSIKLSQDKMFATFFPWKRYKYKYVRESFTRNEKPSRNRIKPILIQCFIWQLFNLSIIWPVELAGNILPLKIFTLLSCWIVPFLIWDLWLSDIINTKFILNEFRTPRITIMFGIAFYLFPTMVLFGDEFRQLWYGTLGPYYREHASYPFRKLMRKGAILVYKKILFLNGLYKFWWQCGCGYTMLLGITAALDNLWNSMVMPRYEKFELSTVGRTTWSVLQCYRIRTTDKLLALWPFIIIAVEIFGRWYFKIWSPCFYNFMRELDYIENMYYDPQHIIEISDDWDGILIRHQVWQNQVCMELIHFVEATVQPLIVPISKVLMTMNYLYKTWNGCVPFALALLWRGVRFRGPDTYPNPSDDTPELPKRLPFISINKDYFKREKKRKLADEDKLIQIIPKCTWQKYFVRWNWCYAFTLQFCDQVVYRGIFKSLVGTANWKLVSVSPSTMLAIRNYVLELEAWLWLFGIICCLYGRCAAVPIFQPCCRFHVGVFAKIQNRFFLPEKTPLVLYPYDVLELKKAVSLTYPLKYITRQKKIKLFIQVQLKKLKENIPKLFLLIIITSYIGLTSIQNLEYQENVLNTQTTLDEQTNEKIKIFNGSRFTFEEGQHLLEQLAEEEEQN